MGTLFSKRQTTEPKTQSTELQSNRKTKISKVTSNFDQMAESESRHRKDKTNNLELYLNDVFEKECVFKAEKEEVEFIQTGIETLVQKIADLVLEGYPLSESEKEDFKRIEKSLVEVYFPYKAEHELKKNSVKEKSARNSIIKVGSFYEETKNNFPDEFDFIFLLFSVKGDRRPVLYSEEFNKAAEHVKTVTTDNRDALKYVSHNDTSKLHFDKYLWKHGPACMLRFIYKNGSGEERYIHVDLVPAFKIIVNQTNDWYAKLVKQKQKTFSKEALSAGSCLRVKQNVSFTETEVHFIKNILSQNHVKVYRILKFLINGHGGGEILELYNLLHGEKGCSSYLIKNMMIYHHDKCTNPDTEYIGHCVLQILEDIYKFTISNTFRSLFGSAIKIPIQLSPDLNTMTETLKTMQTSEDSYDYQKTRMKSVTRQYLDALNRYDPGNAGWFEYLDTLDGDDPSFDSFMEYYENQKDPDFTDTLQFLGSQTGTAL